MTKIEIITREGDRLSVEADSDNSLMEVIRDNGVDEMLALCGGQLSCATCHIHVEEAYLDRLPPMSDYEDDLLDSSDHRRAGSRLSCQIPCDPGLDGIMVTVAPEN